MEPLWRPSLATCMAWAPSLCIPSSWPARSYQCRARKEGPYISHNMTHVSGITPGNYSVMEKWFRVSSPGKPLLATHLVAQTTVEEHLVLSRGGFISQDNWQLIFHEIFLLLLLVPGILTGGDLDSNNTRQQLALGTVPSWAPGRNPGSKCFLLAAAWALGCGKTLLVGRARVDPQAHYF